MARAMPHVARKAAVTRGTMHRPVPRGAFARGRCPRRRTQNPNTTHDQQLRIRHPPGDSQALSTFLFDQTGVPRKFNLYLDTWRRKTESGGLPIEGRLQYDSLTPVLAERGGSDKGCHYSGEADSGPKRPRTGSR